MKVLFAILVVTCVANGIGSGVVNGQTLFEEVAELPKGFFVKGLSGDGSTVVGGLGKEVAHPRAAYCTYDVPNSRWLTHTLPETTPEVSTSVATASTFDGKTMVGYCWEDRKKVAVKWTWNSENEEYDVTALPFGKPQMTGEAEHTQAHPHSLSHDGNVVVGYSGPYGGDYRAVAWRGTDTIVLKQMKLAEKFKTAKSVAISADGRVVAGTMGETSHENKLFIWDGSDETIAPVDKTGFDGHLRCISPDGVLIGVTRQDNAYLWTGSAVQPTPLKKMGAGQEFTSLEIYGIGGIAPHYRIIGSGNEGEEAESAYTHDGQADTHAQSLRLAFEESERPFSEWRRTNALAISANGKWVVGMASDTVKAGVELDKGWIAELK